MFLLLLSKCYVINQHFICIHKLYVNILKTIYFLVSNEVLTELKYVKRLYLYMYISSFVSFIPLDSKTIV